MIKIWSRRLGGGAAAQHTGGAPPPQPVQNRPGLGTPAPVLLSAKFFSFRDDFLWDQKKTHRGGAETRRTADLKPREPAQSSPRLRVSVLNLLFQGHPRAMGRPSAARRAVPHKLLMTISQYPPEEPVATGAGFSRTRMGSRGKEKVPPASSITLTWHV
jgi:hypothetical protein